METLIESLVRKATWKEMLYELIETKRLDPWNVDIIELTDGFLKKIKEMEKLELMIPANIILAASILLRHKSEVLIFIEPVPETPYEETGLPEELPVLSLTSRLLPKRQITIDELVQEIEKVIHYEVDKPKIIRGGIDEVIQLPLNEIDIDKTMDEVYGKLKILKDPEGWVLFSRLIDRREDIMPILLSLLHLAQKEKIDLRQDAFFDEIFIKVV